MTMRRILGLAVAVALLQPIGQVIKVAVRHASMQTSIDSVLFNVYIDSESALRAALVDALGRDALFIHTDDILVTRNPEDDTMSVEVRYARDLNMWTFPVTVDLLLSKTVTDLGL